MVLETYLEAHALTLQQVYQALEHSVGVRREEVVFLSGSLVSGLGNLHSDIDAFIVTSRTLARPTVGDIFMVPLKDTTVDLEWWRPDSVESLFHRVEESTRDSHGRDPRPAMTFTRRELEFLYRLRIGRPLSGEAEFYGLVARLKPEWLARLLFDRSRVVSAALQTDIAGFLQEGDEESAFLAAHDLVGVVADAFLAGHGQINPAPKWRHRGLVSIATLCEEIGLPSRFGGPRMADACLQFWTGSLPRKGLADYARQAVMLLNFVMPWVERRLDTYDPFEALPNPSQGEILPVVEDPAEGRTSQAAGASKAAEVPLGQLKAEARVSWNGSGIHLHLPGEGYAIGIGEVTHKALAYFDGRTTPRQAADSLAASVGTPPEQLLPALLDLRVVLLDCGYLERTNSSGVSPEYR